MATRDNPALEQRVIRSEKWIADLEKDRENSLRRPLTAEGLEETLTLA